MAYYSISEKKKNTGNAFCVRVRNKESGVVTYSKSKTFSSKTAAIKWGKEMVHKVERRQIDTDMNLVDCTIRELIEKYISAKSQSSKPLGRTAFYSLRNTAKTSFANILASKIRATDIVNYALERIKSEYSPSPSTLSVDISCLRKVLKMGKSLFGINVDDRAVTESYAALHDLRLISKSRVRERRLEKDEFSRLLKALLQKQKHHCCEIPYHDIFLFSVLTCCRIGEVCKLRWEDLDVNRKTIVVRDRKHPDGSSGNNSILPLLGESMDLILRQPRVDKCIFPFNSRSITAGFRRTRKKLNMLDLRYHDLRREGASRLIESGYTIEETARVTGHRDLTVLWKIYINIRPEHFHEIDKQPKNII